jgi:hypothetical protein
MLVSAGFHRALGHLLVGVDRSTTMAPARTCHGMVIALA